MPLKTWSVLFAVYVFSVGLSFYFGKNAGSYTNLDASQIAATAKIATKEPPAQVPDPHENTNALNTGDLHSNEPVESSDDEQDTPAESSNVITYEACEQMMAAKMQAAQVGEFVSRASEENLSARTLADDKFEQENIDYEWATDKELTIYQALEEEEALNNVSPHDISCRSQNCRLVIPYNNQAEIEHLSNQFRTALSEQSPSITWLIDEDLGEVVFYLGNDASLFQ